MTLLRIAAPHFVAGVTLDVVKGHVRVVEAVPILKYTIGWTAQVFYDYTIEKRWTWEVVK